MTIWKLSGLENLALSTELGLFILVLWDIQLLILGNGSKIINSWAINVLY